MPAPRDRGRGARARGSDDEFVLFLQGIPAHCRWQELKDMVRQTALHIRQAVVYDDQHGFPTGLGQIIVKNEDEAWRTYHRLSTNGWDGQSLVVTLARTSSPTRPVAGPTNSPTGGIPPNYVAGYSTPPRATQNLAMPPSPISPEPVLTTSPTYSVPEYGPVLSPMGIPHHHQQFIPVFTDPLAQQIPSIPHSPALRPSFSDPLAFTVLPTYSISPIHHLQEAPINSIRLNSQGNQQLHPQKAMYSYNSGPAPSLAYPASTSPRGSPRRTIFMQNLSATTNSKDLKDFMKEAGTIEQCEIPVDAETSLCKGFARITFRNADEAKRAIALYNNSIFMGLKIRVKIDRSMHIAYGTGCEGAMNGNSTRVPLPITPPLSGVDVNISEKKREREETTPKGTDRCGPLVVNGSGIGSKTALAT